VRERVPEVRELDGNMKTLVYDNYNKFISATDTIRKVGAPTGWWLRITTARSADAAPCGVPVTSLVCRCART